MKDPRRMPADVWRPLMTVGVLEVATALVMRDADSRIGLVLLALVAFGARWARLVLSFLYAFGTAFAVFGTGWVIAHGGRVPAEDAAPYAAFLLSAASLICLTSPAVRAWTARPAVAARAADRQDAAPV